MARRLNIKDLKNRIDWALRQTKSTALPVDLELLCQSLGISVEWRCMIPEGVMAAQASGLRIYLQSNFRDDRRARRRQRFTWAHEICHALFYDGLQEAPRLLAGTPGGALLEKLCQQGAGHLLVPSTRLAEDCGGARSVSCIEDLKSLADRYDVSEDVLLRRLHEMNGVLTEEYAILLLRNRNGEERIEAAAYGPWLQIHLPAPKFGQSFDAWAQPVLRSSVQTSTDTWIRSIESSRQMTFTRKRRSGNSAFMEVKVVPG